MVNAFSLEGESFTVLGQTFTFTRNPRIAADIDIAINATDALAAAEAVNVINTVLGAGTAIYEPTDTDPLFAGAPNRVSVPNLPLPTDSFVTGGTLYLTDVVTPSDFELESFTLFGETFTFTDSPTRTNDILAVAGDTADVTPFWGRAFCCHLTRWPLNVSVSQTFPRRLTVSGVVARSLSRMLLTLRLTNLS